MNKGFETPFFMKFRQISRLKIDHLLINFAKQFLCWLNIFQDKRTSRDSAKHHEKETLLILPTPNHESYWSACWLDLIWPVIKIILCKFIIHNFPTCIKGKVKLNIQLNSDLISIDSSTSKRYKHGQKRLPLYFSFQKKVWTNKLSTNDLITQDKKTAKNFVD